MKNQLSLVLILLGMSLSAQPNLDSLWNIWNDKTQPDTIRLKAMDNIAWEGYLYSQPDSAFYFAQLQYDLAEQRGLKKPMAMALNTQGVSLWLRGDYPQALDHYQKSFKIYEEMGNKKGIALSLNNIGIIYSLQGDFPRALDYFQRSLKVKEEVGDKKGIAGSLNNIAGIYVNQKNYPQALDHFQRSLKIKEESGDKKEISTTLSNIGVAYQDQGDYPKALDYNQRVLKISEEIGDKTTMVNTLCNLGMIYQAQGDYPKAMEYNQRSLKTSEEIRDKKGIATALNSIGSLYQAQGDHQRSISECSKGLQLAKEIGAVPLQRDACKCLYDAYKSTGSAYKALEYYEQMTVLNDSLFNEENTKKLTRLEMQYKFDEQEAATHAEQEKKDAIAAQEMKRQKLVRNGFMGGFSVVLLFAVVFLMQRNRIGKEKARSEELLLNILPEEVAEELKNTGSAAAKHFDEATILFTDYKGFTEASEKLSPQELVEELNTCFKAFDHIITARGIEKIKTIGDAYMCVGGLPDPNSSNPAAVVHAALEMQAFMITRKVERDAQGSPAFEMRVGIHTGPVVAGIVGVKKFQYDIWGDTVNTASRMESSGEVGQVNISEATYTLVKDVASLNFSPRGKVQAKGKGEMEMYFVSRSTDLGTLMNG